MNTYVAQIIYRIDCEGVIAEQYEEQWRLVFADNEDEAVEQAKKIAATEATTFIDRHGRAICWNLIAVKDLQPVVLENGVMLFSVLKEVEPVAEPVWMQ
jgi:Domain of unknown function (DUF4288)